MTFIDQVQKLLRRLHYLILGKHWRGGDWSYRWHLRTPPDPSRWQAWEAKVRALSADQPRLHFLTFGDGLRFTPDRLAGDVRHLTYPKFDTILPLDIRDFSAAYRAKHGGWLKKNPHGFGYWTWKGHFITRALRVLNEGDILIYADTGCTVREDAHHARDWQDFLARLRSSRDGIGVYRNFVTTPFAQRCKQDVLDALGVEPSEVDKLHHYAGGRIYLRKGAAAVKLMEDWNALVEAQRYELFDATPSRAPNVPKFSDPQDGGHLNDQAVLSILLYQGGYEVLTLDHEKIIFPARLSDKRWRGICRQGDWGYALREDFRAMARADFVQYLRWRKQQGRLPAPAHGLIARLEKEENDRRVG